MKKETIDFAPCKEYSPFGYEMTEEQRNGAELTPEQLEKQQLSNDVHALRDFVYSRVDRDTMEQIGETLSTFTLEQLKYFYNQAF